MSLLAFHRAGRAFAFAIARVRPTTKSGSRTHVASRAVSRSSKSTACVLNKPRTGFRCLTMPGRIRSTSLWGDARKQAGCEDEPAAMDDPVHDRCDSKWPTNRSAVTGRHCLVAIATPPNAHAATHSRKRCASLQRALLISSTAAQPDTALRHRDRSMRTIADGALVSRPKHGIRREAGVTGPLAFVHDRTDAGRDVPYAE